jgi:hypothetical protein
MSAKYGARSATGKAPEPYRFVEARAGEQLAVGAVEVVSKRVAGRPVPPLAIVFPSGEKAMRQFLPEIFSSRTTRGFDFTSVTNSIASPVFVIRASPFPSGENAASFHE